MANVKSLSDLNEGDDDKGGKFNDYYAGGEKRCARFQDLGEWLQAGSTIHIYEAYT